MGTLCAVHTFCTQSNRFRNVRSPFSFSLFTAKGFAHLPFVFDILRHGSRGAAEAIFKADAWNVLSRQLELPFPVLRVGATGSRIERERLVPGVRVWSRFSLI